PDVTCPHLHGRAASRVDDPDARFTIERWIHSEAAERDSLSIRAPRELISASVRHDRDRRSRHEIDDEEAGARDIERIRDDELAPIRGQLTCDVGDVSLRRDLRAAVIGDELAWEAAGERRVPDVDRAAVEVLLVCPLLN